VASWLRSRGICRYSISGLLYYFGMLATQATRAGELAVFEFLIWYAMQVLCKVTYSGVSMGSLVCLTINQAVLYRRR